MKYTSLLILSVAGLLSACGGGDDSDQKRYAYYSVKVSPAPPVGKEATVTYRTSSGVSQAKTMGGSFGRSVAAEDGDFLYVSVQNSQSTGFVTAEIEIAGKTWKKSSSTAAYGIATAYGTCCD